MNVTITARHCEISDSLRIRAEERALRLARYDDRIQTVELVFDEDHGERRVEARVSVKAEPPVLGAGGGEDFRGALDQVMDRVTRRVKRLRERRRDHQAAAKTLAEPTP